MKKRITTYTFDASAGTITFGFSPEIEGFSLITNVVDNVVIYQFNDNNLGGTVLTNVLTLTYDTSSMSDTDELMILYDDGVDTATVTANAGTNLNTSALAVETGGNLAAIKANTDDIETLLGTIEGNQLPDGHNVTIDNVSIDVDTGLTGLATETTLSSIDGNVNTIAGGIGALATTDSVQALGTAMTDNTQVTQIVNATGDVVTVTGNKLDVNASIDTTGLALAANQQTDALTDAELRATAVPISGTVTANTGLDLSGLATSAKQLPDGHEVEVNNFPTEYPLPAAQITTLTPPAAITGFATSAKQLADNHQVTVSNIANTPVITGFATETTLDSIKDTDGIKKITDALPTGTNSIGKISDITTSIIPGTGATNLGKAKGSQVGATDTGVAILGKLRAADSHTDEDEGAYDTFSMTDFHELRTKDQRAIDLANCNVYTDYTAISNDTTGIANSTNHVFGAGAVTFNKVNGADNTVYGGVYKTMTAFDVSEIFEAGGFVGIGAYLPSLTNVINVFLRIGTDTTNYNCWTWPVANLTASTWMNLRTPAATPDYARNAGNGWNTAAISYVAFGVEFNSEANTLSGIIIDHVHMVGGRITSTDTSTAITTNVNTANMNILKVGGTPTDTGNGTTSAGTLRVTVSSDTTGVLSVDDNGGALTVDNGGTFAVQSTNQANSGVDIGDVTINNAAGAAAVNIQDGGNTITVDGSVTANAGTNLNTSTLAVESGGNLASIKTNTDKIPALGQALAGASVPVILPAATITTLTPPAAITGFATSAKQDTIAGYVDGIEGYVDGIEGLLTTIDADTSNVSTKIDTLAGAVAGTEVQVDVLTMPMTTVQGTITANLSATDNAVLDDIAANQTDGTQKTQIIDSGGEAVTVTGGKLDVNASIDTTGLATSAKQDTIIGHIDGIEGYVDGIETTLTAINNKLVTGTDIGDVTINNSTGANAVNIQDGGNTITVDGTVTANTGLSQPLTDTQLRATAVPISVATIPSHNVTNAGTFATQATLAAETTKVIGTVNVAAAQSIAVTQSGTWDEVGINDSGNSITVDGTVLLGANSGVDIGKLTANQSVNVAQMNGATVTMGNGAAGTGVQRVTIASDSTGQIKLAAGTAGIGKLTANSGVDIGDVDILSIAAGNNNIGDVDVASIAAGTNIIGKVGHDITGIGHGVKTVTTAGTDVALAASTVCKKVDIQAQTDNTSLIAVGGSGVDATIATGTGIVLNPGDTYSLEIDNLADVYIDSLVNGEGVRFTYYT